LLLLLFFLHRFSFTQITIKRMHLIQIMYDCCVCILVPGLIMRVLRGHMISKWQND
jgi:hypothetical protein